MTVTIIAALIAAISAIIAPSITTVINNRHIRKMKKLEMYTERMIDTINNYISAASSLISKKEYKTRSEYAKYRCLIFLYTSDEIWDSISKFDDMIECQEYDKATAILSEIAKKLSKYTLIP